MPPGSRALGFARLLQLGNAICGEAASRRVIEPLLADWQREVQESGSRATRMLAMTSGGFAFVRSVTACALVEGVWIPPLRGTLLSLVAISFSIAVSIAVLLIPPLSARIDVPRSLSEPLIQRYLLYMAGNVLPPAFLLALFVMRRDRRATVRHAVIATMIIAVSMVVVVLTTTFDALERRYDTFETQEHMREFAIASHRAGRFVFAGQSYQRELTSTVEERRARFERFRARMEAMRQQDPPPTIGDRITQFRPVALSVIFAIMGWTLAGLGTPTVTRGLGWWALMFAAAITLTGLLTSLIQVRMLPAPQWAMLPLFGVTALALVTAARRIPKARVLQ